MKIAGLWRSRDIPFLGEPGMRTISLRMRYSNLVPFTFVGFRKTEGPLGLNLCGHLYGAHIEFALM